MKIEVTEQHPQYINQLTWLRGIAAFFVIVSHTIRATEVEYYPSDEVNIPFFITLLDLGNFGVILFFALSGCTLYISQRKALSINELACFYIKRFFRIWPAFAVSLIFYLLFRNVFAMMYSNVEGYWIEKQFLESYSLADLWSYLSLSFNILGSSGLFNNAYWSLPVEFQYYLIFPVIVLSIKFMGLAGPIIIAVVLYLLPKYGIVNFKSNMFFILAFSFCGGVLVGHIYETYPVRIWNKLGIVIILFAIFSASAITNSFVVLPDFPVISGVWNWYGGLAILCVYLVMVTRIKINLKLQDCLERFGKISYSLYLYHNLFIGISTLLIINLKIHDGLFRFFFTFIFTFILTYYVSLLSFKYVERPSISLGRKFLNPL